MSFFGKTFVMAETALNLWQIQNYHTATMKLTGTFYFIGEKDDVLKSIDETMCAYNRNDVSCNKHDGALLKSYCHAAIKVLDSYFASDLRAVRKCRTHFEKLASSDILEIVPYRFLDVSDTLNNLKTIVMESVKICDMPSCKDILELSLEDAVSVANNFNSDRNSKGVITIGMLGKKIGDIITIADIRSYYRDRLDGLEREIDEDKGQASVTESFLLAKFKCELGYCHKAIIKTGVGLFKGVHDLVKQADDDIEAFRMMEAGQVAVN